MSGAIIDHPIARECPIVNKPAFFSGGLELVVRAMKSRNPTHATKTAEARKNHFFDLGLASVIRFITQIQSAFN
jgi:hypothetical protein